MENYKSISVQDFVRLDPENEHQNKFELKGIPRSISIEKHHEEGNENFWYKIDLYLQEKDHIVPVYLGGKVFSGVNFELLKACGESNIEIGVYGYCEPSIYFPRLRVEIANVLGHNLRL